MLLLAQSKCFNIKFINIVCHYFLLVKFYSETSVQHIDMLNIWLELGQDDEGATVGVVDLGSLHCGSSNTISFSDECKSAWLLSSHSSFWVFFFSVSLASCEPSLYRKVLRKKSSL